jgi:hypothetical protein
MLSPQSQPLRDYTNIKFEILIVVFSILPFFVLAYFYHVLPEQVPVPELERRGCNVGGEKRDFSSFACR